MGYISTADRFRNQGTGDAEYCRKTCPKNSWRDTILNDFVPNVSKLTLVTDAVCLMTEEILALELRRRVFDLIEYFVLLVRDILKVDRKEYGIFFYFVECF